MDSTILYKFAKRLNRPYSRYKTAAECPPNCSTAETGPSENQVASEPVYQEITDMKVDARMKKSPPTSTSSIREKPEKPAPYSGTLIKRSLDMSDGDIKSPVSYRDRSKSSSHLEDRITSQIIITNNRASSVSRYSAQSLHSVQSVQSLSPSMSSTSSSVFNGHERLPEMPGSTAIQKVRESGPETQETACLQREKNISSNSLLSSESAAPLPINKQVKATAKQKEEEEKKEGKKTAMDGSTESELYVFMAATDSIRESISSPHLLEDNMYVTMTPVSHRRPMRKESKVHEYYNVLHNDRIGHSLPDLVVKQTSIELSEDDEKLEKTPAPPTNNPLGLYEEVDYTRPVPPPRRKKLMKLQSQTMKVSEHSPSPARLSVAIIPPKEESPQPNRYTYSSDSRNSFIRKRTSTMPHKNSPNRQRRPIGMVFNDIVISEDLEKEISVSPQSPVS
ncbi:PREDICTED: uncharacterized protein LOC109580923 [Amphimedon queenslandica]|uniref:Uncharacterized protein n=1 Tax=Amphimedon queenslandica TaxID=400682 RepID=A0A1X7VAJ3_AMPQE|nr:PREDICTED: uncharacterized protein LOC109580923 [Amphimedon queenslandica]|eukprot:XP_019850076.1 PREDICTED: uncharacterized protein LOC109580923 [Amphimedon queenslandica]